MSAPVSRRARPAKAPLSRDVIVETGLRILDREGLAALTMRRVAQDLDTGAASLYVYVANRDDLMAAMLDHVLGTVPEPQGGSWRERLDVLVESAVAVMSKHEGLALVALGAIPTSPNALALFERLLKLLDEGGLDPRTSSWAVDLLYLYITAQAAEQSAYNVKGGTTETNIAAAQQKLDELPADRYPMIAGLREHLLYSGDAREGWALRVLINGILATPAE
ncbi:TetR/AcrR family transcriptional regulator [Nocardia sp. XZ_19_385]|uniref:TetR/AcrR family transcriptional regulator n=1 Tax=Nocardia sp. XZ_19_385 TaxID=2769488 RepID=UPI00188F9B0E|nr:TetR/AcrR family transcriptional regulator [Nocardia sp. XZ_19_385]